MPSKLDLLRQGQAIEFEPGLSGRLNKEKKTLELSNGRVLNVANDRDYFPADDSQLRMSKQREYAEQGAKGPVGEFLHQYTSQGIPGGISDWPSYLTQTGEDYAQRNAANQEVSQRISKESPYISGAATGANIATDLALTRGMSALKAAPLLTLGSAGSRLATDPENVAAETVTAAAGGKLLDMGGNWLSNAAKRRGASRALPGQQQAVREANELQTQQHNFLKQNVKNSNEAKLQQHQTELNARQNRMIEAQNSFESARAARDAEVIRLKNQAEVAKVQRSSEASRLDSEYKAAKTAAEQENKRLADEFKLAQNQYQESLKQLPELQKKAQAEYSSNVVKNAQEIERNFPKNSRISTEDLGVADFLDSNVNKSGLAGSTQSSQARRVLNSLFPEGELIGGRELSKRYKALEDSIQRAQPEVQTVLNEFKQHLGNKLPTILEDSVAYHKIYPLLKRTIEGDIKSIMREIRIEGKGMETFKDNLTRYEMAGANTNLKHGITPSNFIKKLQSGELSREIANNILTPEDFLIDLTKEQLKGAQKQGLLPILMQEAEKKHAFFVKELSDRLQNKLARYEIKAVQSAQTASQKLGKDVKKTFGMAEPVAPPPAPTAPSPVGLPSAPGELPPIAPINLPPPVQPPVTPPMPGKPQLAGMPEAPIPMAEPMLPPAQGLAERTGDLMEKNIMGGKGLVDNPVTKLAGLKYLLGGAALPAEAAYVGMNALTSPGAAGEVARLTFKQGGIRAIESWAQRYPSYHDGILENPQERRSLTKEIEDAYDIPIEQKAMLQSKVNRGKPLQERL